MVATTNGSKFVFALYGVRCVSEMYVAITYCMNTAQKVCIKLQERCMLLLAKCLLRV